MLYTCISFVQELAGKNNEIMEETSKVRMDLNRRIDKLEAERQTKGELYDKIAELEKELSGLFLHLFKIHIF
jgi:hypothetical protein